VNNLIGAIDTIFFYLTLTLWRARTQLWCYTGISRGSNPIQFTLKKWTLYLTLWYPC